MSDTTSDLASLSEGSKKLLYLLDASHKVEERLLNDWLAEQHKKYGFGDNADIVVVPIAQAPETIPTRVLSIAAGLPEDTLVVPLRVVWMTSIDGKSSAPRIRDLLRGNPRRPGMIRARRILLTQPNRVHCIAAEPATLGQLKERFLQLRGKQADKSELADFIASQAGLALDIAERKLQGSRYKVPRQVSKNLAASTRFKAALAEVATSTQRSLSELEREASSIMEELISVPTAFWIDIMAQLNRKVISLGYKNNIVINRDSLERIASLPRDYATVFLWTHKTHVDGFAMHSLLYESDIPTPHVIGGINMAFGGLGYAAKRAGAVFIRRSFQDNPVYKLVLREYIGYLLEKRFPLSWAFEGTRSRVGKLMPPRYGILKYVIEAAQSTETRNLHIIPMAINYDLIGDVRDYAVEQAGATKTKESLSWFIGYLRGLKQPMGRIYVDFGEPVVLDRATEIDSQLALQKLAFKVGMEVNKVTPVTLTSLVTMVLLGASPRALTRDELIERLHTLVSWCRNRQIPVTDECEFTDDDHLSSLAQILLDSRLVTVYDSGPDEVYRIDAEQHAVASYYRNTTIHHFVNKAISELALLHAGNTAENRLEAFWAEADRLRDLFKFEFFYSPSEEFRQQVKAELDAYSDTWEKDVEAKQGYALALLNRMAPMVAHSTLLTFVEAYQVVADILGRHPSDAEVDSKDVIAQALAYGQQAYMQRRVSSPAAIGKLLFENGYKLFENMGLTQPGTEQIEQRKQMSRDLRDLAHRIEVIRTIALPL